MLRKLILKLPVFLGPYTSVGCWADYDRHAADLSMETTETSLQDNYLVRKNAIEKCAEVAYSKKFNIFALHDGGACSSGSNLHVTFDEDGKSNNCAFGKGGAFANDVYELSSKFFVVPFLIVILCKSVCSCISVGLVHVLLKLALLIQHL